MARIRDFISRVTGGRAEGYDPRRHRREVAQLIATHLSAEGFVMRSIAESNGPLGGQSTTVTVQSMDPAHGEQQFRIAVYAMGVFAEEG